MGRYTYLVEKQNQPDAKKRQEAAAQSADVSSVPPVRGVPPFGVNLRQMYLNN